MSGTYYYFRVDIPNGEDIIVGSDSGIKIIIKRNEFQIIEGSRLDYKGYVKPPRFLIVRNPNQINICACGRSFGNPYPGKKTVHCKAYEFMEWDV